MMFRICAAALAATAVIGAASAAAAAPVIDEFARICLAAKSTADAVERARADGYVKAPDEIRKRMAASFPSDGEILWRVGEAEMSLFVGAVVKRDMANSATQAVSGDLCLIGSSPPPSDLKGGVERLLNVGAEQVVGKSTAYVFEQTESGPERLDASDRGLMAVKAVQGSVRMVGVIERSGMSGLMLMIPAIAAK